MTWAWAGWRPAVWHWSSTLLSQLFRSVQLLLVLELQQIYDIESFLIISNLCEPLLLPQEAASWAIHNLLLHGAGVNHSEEEQDERYTLKR